MTDTLKDDLLHEFMHGFYGYGDYNAPYWFVGIEEGGARTVEGVNRRLRLWKERGKRELEDLAEWHLANGPHRHFSGRVALQRTWNRLMRILLCATDRNLSLSVLREYQKERLGRIGGETALVELLPLPSPSTSHWLYAEHSTLAELVDRQTYHQQIAPGRAARLRARILVHRPKAVVFYSASSTYRRWWEKIARADFEQVDDAMYRASQNSTDFVICKHPVAHGVSNDYFHRVGKLLAITN